MQQHGEEVLCKVKRLPLRHIAHRPRGDDIDPRAHEIRHHLRPVRLFHKVLHAAVSVQQHQPVAQRLEIFMQRHRHGGAALPMPRIEPAQIKVAHRVPAHHEKILISVKIPALQHAPRRSDRVRLHAVFHLHAELRPVAEVRLNLLRPVAQRGAELCKAVFPQQMHDPLHHRHAEHLCHRLRCVTRHDFQPRALSAGQNHCLHAPSSFFGISV